MACVYLLNSRGVPRSFDFDITYCYPIIVTPYLDIIDLKKYIGTKLKPHKFKHYARGPKYSNTLLTCIRVGRSYLKSHSFSIGMSDTNICSCNSKVVESPLQYITQCPNFNEMRKTFFYQVEQNFIPQFKRLSLRRQFDILVHGYQPYDPELTLINTKLSILTQNFILKTKRFADQILS